MLGFFMKMRLNYGRLSHEFLKSLPFFWHRRISRISRTGSLLKTASLLFILIRCLQRSSTSLMIWMKKIGQIFCTSSANTILREWVIVRSCALACMYAGVNAEIWLKSGPVIDKSASMKNYHGYLQKAALFHGEWVTR